MKKEQFVEESLEELAGNGSNIRDLEEIKARTLGILEHGKDASPRDAIAPVIEEIAAASRKFLEARNQAGVLVSPALSTCIYLPSNGGYKLKFVGGHVSRTEGSASITSDTLFDVASITKLYTFLLTFKLEEYGYFKLTDQISKLCPKYQGFEDFTIEDILLLCGEFQTDSTLGNITDAPSYEAAHRILESTHLVSNDRSRNKYTDWGSMVLGDVIAHVVSEKVGCDISYDVIMNHYLLEPFGLENTMFHPDLSHQTVGTGNDQNLVHDKKARSLGGVAGHAGIFTNSDDLAALALEMFRVKYVNYNKFHDLVSASNLEKMGTVTFPDSDQSNKGLLGLYQKHPDRADKYLAPLDYGNHVFTAQGFTGTSAIFDPVNEIHNSILLAGVKEDHDMTQEGWKNQKPEGFMNDYYRPYQEYIVKMTLILLLSKKYKDLEDSKENVVDESIHL